ncbi:hypothetical protein [Labrenzia sp. VG12]|uniref:hypothetical protein n=1 Tax=Labrenzia sp. VG12 TaxID=2021862 RepID=UPI000B8BF18E|nr:hypothetical protein [Labrenzia sp. VG12]ASP32910.1 hypothetical protein CHH27_06310 [Labrenzia sp. VG12]
MGTVGLASYQFSYVPTGFPSSVETAGLRLPPAGDVETTASIPTTPGPGQRPTLEVMQLPERGTPPVRSDLSLAQMDVLQREIVGLRRRLSALSEQNVTYSRRIAALEKQVAVAKLSGQSGPVVPNDTSAEPGPGVVITKAPIETKPDNAAAPEFDGTELAEGPAQAENPAGLQPRLTLSETADTKSPPRLISIYRNESASGSETPGSIDPEEPVRIVELSPRVVPQVRLPEATDEPVVTGSIPKANTQVEVEVFDATPTQTTLRPKIITPSSPAGRLRGGGDSQLKRSDFGAIIGHYRTSAGAAKAWADFKTQNEERMRDLRPLLMQRQTEEGGIALMVGPFANAADAAVACLHLLDVTELCHPTLYAGDPLVTAAEFRDTAF